MVNGMFDDDYLDDVVRFMMGEHGRVDSEREREREREEWNDYIPPQICENCGSKNVIVRINGSPIESGGIRYVGYTCNDCNYFAPLRKVKVPRDMEEKWRGEVLRRYNRCAVCGRKDEKLYPHRIIPKVRSKEYEFDVNNGVALCERCKSLADGK